MQRDPLVIGNSTLVIRGPRRGTVLVFVLGVLTLLSLVGLVLLARTHGEFQRVYQQVAASNDRMAMDGLIHGIQQTLRRDLWGSGANPTLPLNGPYPPPANTVAEQNEPFDAPGDADHWLSSITPYMALNEDPTNPNPEGSPRMIAGYTPLGQPYFEPLVLIWPFVSYLGSDLLQNSSTQPFMWDANTRVPNQPTRVTYSSSNLAKVRILQTPPPGTPATLIPGSTTSVSIATARAVWNQINWANPPLPPGTVPQFPYFDTNADGILDLYDADGDGIPDSPLSLVVPVDSSDPNAPRRLYAAIRIVDHAGMVNVNVASSLRKPEASPSATDLTFGEARPGLQRRGQRTAELLLDEAIHADDRTYDLPDDRARETVLQRSGAFPDLYDQDFIRTKLIGGRAPATPAYFLYGTADEASLRHRGSLVPYSRRDDRLLNDYSTIDRALRNTLLWKRETTASGSYTDPPPPTPNIARWTRVNANYGSASYEGVDDVNGKGWRSMLSEDEPFAIRRQRFTTVSHEVIPGPRIATDCASPLGGETFVDCALRQRLSELWSLNANFLNNEVAPNGWQEIRMDWPVFIEQGSALASLRPPGVSSAFTDKFLLPANKMPTDAFRVQPIDLNMGDASAFEAKKAFISYAAAAMYLALEGQTSYQGITLAGPGNRNREYLAWQFALNLRDYRDVDDVPSVIEWPIGMNPPHYLFGVEKQPFFTEAYAYLKAGNPPGPGPVSGPGDKWFFAVELYVPPYWTIPTANLYFHGASPTPYPLSSFVHRTLGTPPGVMDGGSTGKYFVFCGIDPRAPDIMRLPGGQDFGAYQEFYQFSPSAGLPADFLLRTDGTGSAELVYQNVLTVPAHVLDVIGPSNANGSLVTNSSAAEDPSRWAVAQHCVNCPPSSPGCVCPGDTWEYSLLRSTNGWRFTTCWHFYKDAPARIGPQPSSGASVRETLGRANSTSTNGRLDPNIPESIWPGRATLTGANPPDSFAGGLPFSAFDSPGDLGRMMLIGPLTQTSVAPPVIDLNPSAPAAPLDNMPTTALLANIIKQGVAGTPPDPRPTPQDLPPLPKDRITAGRPDFAPYKAPAGSPPTRRSSASKLARLFDYFTTQSPLFDGVDNDGNGTPGPPCTNYDMADPAEAFAVLNRVAGRININTAPASVLRSIPYMSLLPTSPEYLFHVVMNGGTVPIPPTYNPAEAYFNSPTPKPFWDFASPIVARRENRDAALRLLDPTVPAAPNATQLRTVAIAGLPPPPAPGPGPVSGGGQYTKGPFTSIAELQRLIDRVDRSATADPEVFCVDRFAAEPTFRLPNHRYAAVDPPLPTPLPPYPAATPDTILSPDYRFRRTTATDGIIDYSPVLPASTPLSLQETGGQRARDIFLSRMGGLLTVRSDVFTAYIALIDENGNYVQRSQVTLDRSGCFRETTPLAGAARTIILPEILSRIDTSYSDDTK